MLWGVRGEERGGGCRGGILLYLEEMAEVLGCTKEYS